MTAIILILVLAAAVIGLGTAFGGPILGAILAVVAVVVVIAWFVGLGGSRTTARQVVRKSEKREFLGPGGPDDPGRRP